MGFRAEFDMGVPRSMARRARSCGLYREHQMSADGGIPQAQLAADQAGHRIADAPRIAKADGTHRTATNEHARRRLVWQGGVAQLALSRGTAGRARQMAEGDGGPRVCRAMPRRYLPSRHAGTLSRNCSTANISSTRWPRIISTRSIRATGCEIDQVFGQSWAFQVGLGRVLPEEETRDGACDRCGTTTFRRMSARIAKAYQPGRWYAMPGEAVCSMCTFPRTDWD